MIMCEQCQVLAKENAALRELLAKYEDRSTWQERLTLYEYSRLPADEQARLWKALRDEIEADQAAGKPTLVKKYLNSCRYHVMIGRTRRANRSQFVTPELLTELEQNSHERAEQSAGDANGNGGRQL